MTAVDTSLPPTLFDLAPTRRVPVYTPSDAPFVPYADQLCGFCRRKLRNCSTVHGCGRGDVNGWYWVCDDCATEDPHWGITREYLAIDRMRRKVYAAGGGETEVHAAPRPPRDIERRRLLREWTAADAAADARDRAAVNV